MKPKNNAQTRQILRQMHKDAPVYVPFILIMKKDFTTSFSFYLFSYFFRFIGILILSGNCDIESTKGIKTFASWARFIK